jgi:hypothetical protein
MAALPAAVRRGASGARPRPAAAGPGRGGLRGAICSLPLGLGRLERVLGDDGLALGLWHGLARLRGGCAAGEGRSSGARAGLLARLSSSVQPHFPRPAPPPAACTSCGTGNWRSLAVWQLAVWQLAVWQLAVWQLAVWHGPATALRQAEVGSQPPFSRQLSAAAARSPARAGGQLATVSKATGSLMLRHRRPLPQTSRLDRHTHLLQHRLQPHWPRYSAARLPPPSGSQLIMPVQPLSPHARPPPSPPPQPAARAPRRATGPPGPPA